jgi:hypothetical protein
MEASGSLSAEVSREGVRLQSFWIEGSTLWFDQVEAEFHLVGICDETTKFCYVTAQLDHQLAAEVEDIITSPPQQEPYTKLKKELVNRLYPSRDQRTRQLFTIEEMGNRKPSQFLRHLSGLAPYILDYLLRIL